MSDDATTHRPTIGATTRLPLRTSEERRAFAALVRDAQLAWLRADDDGDGVANALDAPGVRQAPAR
jgi:hypothetical protein